MKRLSILTLVFASSLPLSVCLAAAKVEACPRPGLQILQPGGLPGGPGPGNLKSRVPIGGTLASYTLHDDNTYAFGLAYDERTSPHRLYVSDYTQSKIFVYEVGVGRLIYLPGSSFKTNFLYSAFKRPRGIALGRYGGRDYLYVLTCNTTPAGSSAKYDSRLWRVDLANRAATQWVDLDRGGIGLCLRNKKVFGLAYYGGRVFISYDTSALGSTAISQGILKLKVWEGRAPNNWWTRLRQISDILAVDAIMPNSGRETPSSTYKRAPSFGLAHMVLGGTRYLWCTSYYKIIYLAHASTGRGIFYFGSPNTSTLGLTYGNSHLWATSNSRSGADRVHKINITSNYTLPLLGRKHVRQLTMKLQSKARVNIADMNVRHNFAEIWGNAFRPNQDLDRDSQHFTTDRCDPPGLRRLSYWVGGDWAERQYYYRVPFSGRARAGDLLQSTYDVVFWTSDYRQLVYPHLCTRSAPARGDYTSDDEDLYDISDTGSYSRFWRKLRVDLRREYGASATPSNSYWRARNIVEFVCENYRYGPTHYHPATDKMNVLFDGDKNTNVLSCSSSTFVLIGLCRYLGVPARWVGTTYQNDDWDANRDGLLTRGEKATDTAFHRWAEVWMGDEYGWQRFDPTPSKTGPRKFSQWELMRACAHGVGSGNLVMTVGSGREDPFWETSSGGIQGYNAQSKYIGPRDSRSNWDIPDPGRNCTWQNACFLTVTSPSTWWQSYSSAGTMTVCWNTSGRWDLDRAATVSVYAYDGRRRKLLESGVDPDAGVTVVRLAGATRGFNRIYVTKDGDGVTGGRSVTIRIR